MYQDDRFTDGYIVGANSGNNNGWGNGFGGDWLALLVILALFGWGGNGNGFGGGFGGGNNLAYELGKVATTNDVASGFNNSAVLNSLNDIKLTQASNLNFINQGFAGLNTQLLSGFHGVDNAICTLGYQNQQGFNTIAHQISDCCCATQRAIDRISYENAKNTCDIIQANTANTQRVLDFLTSEKICGLQSENASLKAQISNDRQTRTIVNELRDGCPVPAYLTCNPKTPYPYPFSGNGCSGCGSL